LNVILHETPIFAKDAFISLPADCLADLSKPRVFHDTSFRPLPSLEAKRIDLTLGELGPATSLVRYGFSYRLGPRFGARDGRLPPGSRVAINGKATLGVVLEQTSGVVDDDDVDVPRCQARPRVLRLSLLSRPALRFRDTLDVTSIINFILIRKILI
jgi:hypothetical protein